MFVAKTFGDAAPCKRYTRYRFGGRAKKTYLKKIAGKKMMRFVSVYSFAIHARGMSHVLTFSRSLYRASLYFAKGLVETSSAQV